MNQAQKQAVRIEGQFNPRLFAETMARIFSKKYGVKVTVESVEKIGDEKTA
nr:hypothetical protein [uncultured Blautia sp.]